jgi:alkylhydroperoxidase family enzyme
MIVGAFEPEVATSTGLSGDRSVWDYVPHVTRTFLLQPEGYQAWKASRNDSVNRAIDRRWNRLATIAASAAARAIRRPVRGRRRLASVPDRSFEPEVGSLDATDLAVVLFAAKVAAHTDRISEADVAMLRALGLTDGQVFDIALAAAASSFFADAAADTAAS